MTAVGIEALNAFGGSAYLDVEKLARHRNLDMTPFANLLKRIWLYQSGGRNV